MIRLGALLLVAACNAPRSAGSSDGLPQPIVDMHLHAYPIDFFGPPPQRVCAPGRYLGADPKKPMRLDTEGDNALMACAKPIAAPGSTDELRRETLATMERLGVVAAMASGPEVDRWRAEAAERILPGLHKQIFETTPDELRGRVGRGELVILAEVAAQYAGVAPDDPVLERYFAVAEELDIPVGIHMGPGPPAAPYTSRYRAELSDPFGLESVLIAHPRLRVYVMHAGWPLGDAMTHMLFSHPQLHVDVSVIDWALPREEFHAYLERLVRAGLIDRIFFGSDQMLWPETLEVAVENVRSAGFLTPEQRHAIFYGNAARFLRFDEARRRRHLEMAAQAVLP